MGSYHHVQYQKKLMIQSWENLVMDGRTDGQTSYFIGRCLTSNVRNERKNKSFLICFQKPLKIFGKTTGNFPNQFLLLVFYAVQLIISLSLCLNFQQNAGFLQLFTCNISYCEYKKSWHISQTEFRHINMQKQLFPAVSQNRVLKIFAILTRKYLCWSLFLITLQPWTL